MKKLINHREQFLLLVRHIVCRMFAIAFFCLFSGSAYSATKNLLVLGDSLSAEYGLARGTGWVALLEQRLAEKHINAKVVNASISGETTSGGKARLAQLLRMHQPDILLLELGSNDALRGLSLEASEKNFRDMIQMAQLNKTKVLLIGMRIPPNYGKDYTERFYAIYPRLAKETHTTLVPFLLEGIAENTDYFQSDRIHPLASAHPILLNNVWPGLQTILNQK